MLDNAGHWLKLMRSANLPTDANVCLRISGEDIFCTVTKDVNKEVELKVTCQIVDPENAQEFEHSKNSSNLPGDITEDSSKSEGKNSSSKNSQEMLDFSSERSESLNEDMHSKSSTPSDCDSTEVERPRNDSDCENSEEPDEGTSLRLQVSPSSYDKTKENASLSEKPHSSIGKRLRENLKHQDPENPPKHHQPPRESIHKCQLCNFTSKYQHYVEKHLHSHRNDSIKRSSKMTNAKSYCEACKIQFMSIDTYHVHKQQYCKGRHEKEDGSSSPSLPEVAFKPRPDTVIIRNGNVNGVIPSTSLIQPQAIYAAISHNPLILLPCSLVNGQGLVPQAGVLPTGAPGIVLQSGIACPTIVETPSSTATSKLKDESPPSRKTSHPIMHFSSDIVDRPTTNSLRKRKMSEGDVLNLKKPCAGASVRPMEVEVKTKDTESSNLFDQDFPLDLSLRKSPCRSPVSRRDSVVSPVCHSPPIRTSSESGSPHRSSVVLSHLTSSPNSSYSNDSVHCYANTIPIVVARQSSIDRASPLPPVLHVDASVEKQSSMPPPKLVKQGNNVCEECEIVFYKYDNFLAHKRHYCAFRRRQLSALAAAASNNQDHSSDDNNSNHSGLNETSQNYPMEEGSKSGPRREEHLRSVITKSSHSVYCCDACGVQFSTSDTLEAHQTYYCIKKADSAMSKAAAMRGENSRSPHGLEPPFIGPEEWKCNYCDATCSSYETIRRHLLTHSELRGFRCIVCGYKGNTLRGMRTHACEHLTEGSTSVEEFLSTKVVAENGIALTIPDSMSPSDDDSDDSRHAKSFNRREQPERSGISQRKNTLVLDHSESNSNSPPILEKTSIHHVPNSTSPVKRETSPNSPARNSDSPHDRVNPMAFCNVVIKTENDATSGDESSSRDGHSKEFFKSEPEPEYDSDDQPQDLSKSPTAGQSSGQSTSVIRRTPEADIRCPLVKRKSKSQNRGDSEANYCKVCDIAFSRSSNFKTHKKFYCASRVIQNCIQEAATVQ